MFKKTFTYTISALFSIIALTSLESSAEDVYYREASERPIEFQPKPPIEKKFFALEDKYIEESDPELAEDGNDGCDRSRMSGSFDHGVNFEGIE